MVLTTEDPQATGRNGSDSEPGTLVRDRHTRGARFRGRRCSAEAQACQTIGEDERLVARRREESMAARAPSTLACTGEVTKARCATHNVGRNLNRQDVAKMKRASAPVVPRRGFREEQPRQRKRARRARCTEGGLLSGDEDRDSMDGEDTDGSWRARGTAAHEDKQGVSPAGGAADALEVDGKDSDADQATSTSAHKSKGKRKSRRKKRSKRSTRQRKRDRDQNMFDSYSDDARTDSAGSCIGRRPPSARSRARARRTNSCDPLPVTTREEPLVIDSDNDGAAGVQEPPHDMSGAARRRSSDDEGKVRRQSSFVSTDFGDGVVGVRTRAEKRRAVPGITKVHLAWATAYLRDECVREVPYETRLVYPSKNATGAVRVTRSDMIRLQDDMFLNDTIIDFYLRYLLSREDSFGPGLTRSTVHIFSPLVVQAITNVADTANPEQYWKKVQKWTKGLDLFSKRIVLFPINSALHWSLLVLCNPDRFDVNAGQKRARQAAGDAASSHADRQAQPDRGSMPIDGQGSADREDFRQRTPPIPAEEESPGVASLIRSYETSGRVKASQSSSQCDASKCMRYLRQESSMTEARVSTDPLIPSPDVPEASTIVARASTDAPAEQSIPKHGGEREDSSQGCSAQSVGVECASASVACGVRELSVHSPVRERDSKKAEMEASTSPKGDIVGGGKTTSCGSPTETTDARLLSEQHPSDGRSAFPPARVCGTGRDEHEDAAHDAQNSATPTSFISLPMSPGEQPERYAPRQASALGRAGEVWRREETATETRSERSARWACSARAHLVPKPAQAAAVSVAVCSLQGLPSSRAAPPKLLVKTSTVGKGLREHLLGAERTLDSKGDDRSSGEDSERNCTDAGQVKSPQEEAVSEPFTSVVDFPKNDEDEDDLAPHDPKEDSNLTGEVTTEGQADKAAAVGMTSTQCRGEYRLTLRSRSRKADVISSSASGTGEPNPSTAIDANQRDSKRKYGGQGRSMRSGRAREDGGDVVDGADDQDALVPCMLLLDSTKGHPSHDVFRMVRKYIEVAWSNTKGVAAGAKDINANALRGCSPPVPLQGNDCDCGVYVIKYAKLILKKPPVMTERFLSRKGRGGMFSKKWFTERDIRDMRSTIRHTVDRLRYDSVDGLKGAK